MPNGLPLLTAPPARLPHGAGDAGAIIHAADRARPAAATPGGPATGIVDGLAARLVRPGDGQRRRTVLTHRERAAAVFKAAGLALAGVVLGLPLAVPALVLHGGMRLAARLCRAVDGSGGAGGTGLAPAVEGALLRKRAGGIDEAALGVLHAYAARIGTPLTPREITELVHAGQNLALALRQPALPGDDRGTVRLEGHAVRCNAWLARALTWYMMAVAAAQDTAASASGPLDDAPPAVLSEMVTNGSLVMRDPEQRLYRFLQGAPQAHPRPSTHFASKSAATERFRWLGLFAGASPRQFGIEDMRKRFPGGGGALLFDTLREPGTGGTQLFVKFEKAGWPPLRLREPAGIGRRLAYGVEAAHRNVAHMLHFVTTRFGGKGGAHRVERLEHVAKGALKTAIHAPFVALIADAIRAGLIAPRYKAILAAVDDHGLPFVAAAVEALYDIARQAEAACVQCDAAGSVRHADARRMERAALDFGERFHQTMDQFGVTLPGVERRGAEVHLDLDAALTGIVPAGTPTAAAAKSAPGWHPVALRRASV